MIGATQRHGVEAPRIVVIDAGKSSVRAALFTGEHLLARHRAETGFPHPQEPGARETVQAAVADILGRLGNGPCDTLVLATTGVRRVGRDELALAAALAEQLGCEVLVQNDVVAAYLGALGPRPGILVQAGTGSFVLGVAAGRPPVRIDGWGYLAGDRGSGFALGRAGVQGCFGALDGTGPATSLTGMIAGSHPEQFLRDLYASPHPVRQIAGWAPTVLRAAAAGDEVAAQAVRDVAAQLVDMVLAAGHRLGDREPATLPVSCIGGLFADDQFTDAVTAALSAARPDVLLCPPAGDALDGGRLLAVDRHDPIITALTRAPGDEET